MAHRSQTTSLRGVPRRLERAPVSGASRAASLSKERGSKEKGSKEGAAVESGVIADLTHEAEGVVRGSEAGGKTVFVAGALPGERVSFRRRSFHKSHDEAELLEVHE